MLEQKIDALTAALVGLTAALTTRPAEVPTPVVEKPKAKKAEPVPEEQKKAEPKPKAEKKEQLTAAEAEAALFGSANADTKPLTYEDVRAAMLELNTKKGREATVAVLKAVGVETVPKLADKPEMFAKVIELAKAGLQ